MKRQTQCLLPFLIIIILVSCRPVKNNQIGNSSIESIAEITPTTSSPTIVPIATETFVAYPCQEPGFPGTVHYANTDSFGDGYISLADKDFVEGKNYEEIVRILVNQWLEHYKTSNLSTSASINDYEVEKITLIDPSCDPFFTIVASVRFSVIPSQVPHEMAGFPGGAIKEGDLWWHLSAPFGVFVDDNNYRLRLVFGWGT
jgi:hypothetical protein